MNMFTPPPFLTGPPEDLRAQARDLVFRNSDHERRTLERLEGFVKFNYTDRIVADSKDAHRNIDDGAREQSQIISGLDARADEVLGQLNSLDMSLRDARKARDEVARALAEAEMEYEAAVEDYERHIYSRDFPEDVINDLLRKYPVLRENLPLFYL